MEKELKKLYFDPGSPACYGGVTALYREAKKRFPKINIKTIEKFLAKQNTYTLHKPVRRKFPRNKIVTAGLDVDWQADLADLKALKKYNSNYTYILVVVDVLSRYLWAVPLKRKTPTDVTNAFEQILKSSGRIPWRLCTDRGTEFKGCFQPFLAKHDIKYFNATSPDVKAAMAERYVKTIKMRLWKYFTKMKTFRYMEVLPRIVHSINHSVHRVTGMRPVDVNRKNQESLWQKLYGKYTKNNPSIKYRFKIGDKVRITKEKHQLTKGYLPNFTEEVFVVNEILKSRTPVAYRLVDEEGEDIEGVFYESELVKVIPPDEPIKVIEKVYKIEKRKDDYYYFVKWQGQPAKKNKWIKESDLVIS